MVLSPKSPFFDYFSGPFGRSSDTQTAGRPNPPADRSEPASDQPGPRSTAQR